MEPGGSMPHSQGFSHLSRTNPINRIALIFLRTILIFFHLRLGLSRGLEANLEVVLYYIEGVVIAAQCIIVLTRIYVLLGPEYAD